MSSDAGAVTGKVVHLNFSVQLDRQALTDVGA